MESAAADTIAYLIGGLIGLLIITSPLWAFLAYLLIRRRQERTDAARRELARQAHEKRQSQREKAEFLADVDRYFPFVRGPFQAGLQEGKSPEEAFLTALSELPALQLGTTFFDLPALLPIGERPKHLYMVGKTGSGKTSLLLHLVREDLEAGRGVGVIAPEAELFRDWLLPLVPEERAREVVYFAPGNPENPITFNPLGVEPGDDQGRASGELFAIFKRAVGEEEFGARMSPILGNAFACLTGRPGATLWDVKRLLEDPSFREKVASEASDEYLRDFWLVTYPSYPKGSHLPVINRLDQFLRPLPVRRAVCRPESSFSIRQVLAEGKILFLDLSGLAPDSMLLLGQMLLSKFQLELMRRETVRVEAREPFHLYADEFQTFAGVAEGTWRDLFSRGRRYGLSLTLAHQYPSQLPPALQNEILGNVASIVAFSLGSKDGQAMRREFLEPSLHEESAQPVPLEALFRLRTGQAVARLGTGAYALRLQTVLPLPSPSQARGERIRAVSWESYGSAQRAEPRPKVQKPFDRMAREKVSVTGQDPEDFLTPSFDEGKKEG